MLAVTVNVTPAVPVNATGAANSQKTEGSAK